MPEKENNIILYTDTDGKENVKLRFAEEKVLSISKVFLYNSTYKQLL